MLLFVACRIENIILLAVLEGPHEPRLIMNSYLRPVVHQLVTDGEDGFDINSTDHGVVRFRFRLYSLVMDIPAMRKCCGFLSHGATKGCSKCLVNFPQRAREGISSKQQDCSDSFRLDSYPIRTRNLYDEAASHILECSNPSQRRETETKYGQRFSVLSRLPYFDIVK